MIDGIFYLILDEKVMVAMAGSACTAGLSATGGISTSRGLQSLG